MPISEAYNVDCMEYMKTVPDRFFDLAVVDPPYGAANSADIRAGRRFGQKFARYKRRGETRIMWDEAPNEGYFKELFRVSKNQIIWGANYFSGLPPTRCFLVWRKLSISERFSMAMAEYAWTSFSGNAKVFEYAPQGDEFRFHPTQKPVALYSWIFQKFANSGDKILDTHMGSQSSRIAAYQAGLDFYGCEIDSDYFRKGCERFDREAKGITRICGKTIIQQSLFDGDGI